jgi:DNA-binding transcriptional ArsR family regulator
MNLRLQIFQYLRGHRNTGLSALAKAIHQTAPAILYQLKQLMDMGIVIRTGDVYEVQEFLRNPEIDTVLYKVFTAVIESDGINTPEECNADIPAMITEGISLLCESFVEQIKKDFKLF